MKVFSLPSDKTSLALLFDMDCTLYTHDEYAQTQIDLPIERLAGLQGKTFDLMKAEISQYRKNWAASNDGKSISLGNIFLTFGISIEESVRWREELYRPEDYLTEDKRLRAALLELAPRFSFAVVTNNPASVAVRTLKVLGVQDIIKNIAGLDTYYLSKPNKEIFIKAADLCGVPVHKCISIGDRYDIDIALPLELGMGGILVNGVEDVYKLPEMLA